MGEGRIEFELGALKFAGQGSESWVREQLEWVFGQLTELKKGGLLEAPPPPLAQTSTASAKKSTSVGSLAAHIKSKGAESNQVMRFLATADWLRLKGENNLKTAMVSKALSDNHQKRLANAADCLNRNVSKGFCEKSGDGFYISPEGLNALGYDG
jgi:hypothetical protein